MSLPLAEEVAKAQHKTIIVQTHRNLVISYLLWLFLGVFGMHRFYYGKWLTGLMFLGLMFLGNMLAWTGIGLVLAWIPLGILGLWWFIDAFRIPFWESMAISKISTEAGSL